MNEHPALKDIIEAMKELLPGHVFHYWANGEHSQQYICVTERSDVRTFRSDNHRQFKIMDGFIDLFTKIEDDPLIDQIERKLDEIGCGFRLNETLYEPQTGYIHKEWTIEFYGTV